MERDTIIIVGVTRKDGFNNLWVTPASGGNEVKIGVKREHLHDLFQQGKAVMLHWETYKNKPYVSDAKPVEGELPPPQPSDRVLPEHQRVIDEAKRGIAPLSRGASIEAQVAIKEIGEDWRAGILKDDDPLVVGYLIWLIDRLNYEEVKGEITKTQTNKTADTDGQIKTGGEVGTDENRPQTVPQFLAYLKDHNIKAPRTWLEVEWEVPRAESLTLELCQELYTKIKQKEGW